MKLGGKSSFKDLEKIIYDDDIDGINDKLEIKIIGNDDKIILSV